MNIQINASTDVKRDEILYIYHNIEQIEKKYLESWEYKAKMKWTYELSGYGGFCSVSRKVVVTGSNDTLYFKFKK